MLAQRQAETGAAVILITHDLGVVAEVAHRVAVMYGGRIVETGPVEEIFRQPRHPYTAALLQSIPRHRHGARRGWIRSPASRRPGALPTGCAFHPRCADRARPGSLPHEDPALRPVGASAVVRLPLCRGGRARRLDARRDAARDGRQRRHRRASRCSWWTGCRCIFRSSAGILRPHDRAGCRAVDGVSLTVHAGRDR